jgi:hypothetical protein
MFLWLSKLMGNVLKFQGAGISRGMVYNISASGKYLHIFANFA